MWGRTSLGIMQQTKDSPARCVLCFGKHTANYKGCTSHKKIRLSQDKTHSFGFYNTQISSKVPSTQDSGSSSRVLYEIMYRICCVNNKPKLDIVTNIITHNSVNTAYYKIKFCNRIINILPYLDTTKIIFSIVVTSMFL
ncbi:unnamed protein product [Aphis gossypii]|uniref:Uncharacterized protein n=1 Tax=Aphis gossypii TaxID=80765 RepID=A0A9P0NJC9_APHGO|nr:unnamed protein product [Aphis gossypii]